MENNEIRSINKRLMELESMIKDIYDATVVDKKKCPICNNEIRCYLPFGMSTLRLNAQCPLCGSLERHRALWIELQKNILLFDKTQLIKLLHFAPEEMFINIFNKQENIDYYPVDFDPNFPGIRKTVDITNIPYENDMFDIIICNHVLEHISDEKKALNEMKRVLKADGIAYINTPTFDQAVTVEDPLYNTPELRLKYYGQADHVRLYGRDYIERLKNGGFKVEVINYKEILINKELIKYGLNESEKIFKCIK